MSAVAPRLAALLLAALLGLAWCVANRPVDVGMDAAPGEKFASLSFAAYRPWESPLTDTFPTEAEADEDMARVARQATAARSYAAIEGAFDTAALAQRHGVKLWQGIWLGTDRAKNELEIARGVALAQKYPDTITRVVVGNEVLLRRDLPVAELIAALDRVRAAVKQPVAYADVWEFWKQFPQVAPHVDVMLIHLLPYWEDTPTGIDRAVDHVHQIYRDMRALFPGKTIAIGETGWPSRGRQRADARPSRVNEARFLRAFLALSRAEHFDYNFIEAFDQTWKYASEGIVGANWGIFDADRGEKIPLRGPIEEDPHWRRHALIGILAGLLLTELALRTRRPNGRGPVILATTAMALGGALSLAAAGLDGTLYDRHLLLAGIVNLPAQTLLAILLLLDLNGRLPAAARTGAETTRALRALLRGNAPPPAAAWLADTQFLFLWTASTLEALLLFDGRYREFPVSSFAVPLIVAACATPACRRPRHATREDIALTLLLPLAALASAIQEGPLNTQCLTWTACTLLLTAPQALRLLPRGRRAGLART